MADTTYHTLEEDEWQPLFESLNAEVEEGEYRLHDRFANRDLEIIEFDLESASLTVRYTGDVDETTRTLQMSDLRSVEVLEGEGGVEQLRVAYRHNGEVRHQTIFTDRRPRTAD